MTASVHSQNVVCSWLNPQGNYTSEGCLSWKQRQDTLWEYFPEFVVKIRKHSKTLAWLSPVETEKLQDHLEEQHGFFFVLIQDNKNLAESTSDRWSFTHIRFVNLDVQHVASKDLKIEVYKTVPKNAVWWGKRDLSHYEYRAVLADCCGLTASFLNQLDCLMWHELLCAATDNSWAGLFQCVKFWRKNSSQLGFLTFGGSSIFTRCLTGVSDERSNHPIWSEFKLGLCTARRHRSSVVCQEGDTQAHWCTRRSVKFECCSLGPVWFVALFSRKNIIAPCETTGGSQKNQKLMEMGTDAGPLIDSTFFSEMYTFSKKVIFLSQISMGL